MHSIKIITSTTRNGRKGISVARWITDLAKRHENFKVELLDLADINLPLMDEPNHPSKRQYQHEHTKEWSQMIDEEDGSMTPENSSPRRTFFGALNICLRHLSIGAKH